MELLATQNTGGRPYLVYFDAEFQTYRIPENNDVLGANGFVKTPYDYGMDKGNFKNNKYHYLLNFGFVVFGPGFYDKQFAAYHSLFKSAAGFENPQLLEPGYTTCAPYTDYRITELRKIIGEKGTFPYFADFSTEPDKMAAFEQINTVYNSSIDNAELMASYATLVHFLTLIAPHAMIVHKGRNDLYALFNTAHLFGLTMPTILTRDIDRVPLRLPGLKKTKLEHVQMYFTAPPPLPNNISTADPVHLRINNNKDGLISLRTTLLDEMRVFFIKKWGPAAGDVAAHNPLVDCVYTAIIDLGLGSSADVAIALFGTDSDGVVKFFV
jgi:hypothetical protein